MGGAKHRERSDRAWGGCGKGCSLSYGPPDFFYFIQVSKWHFFFCTLNVIITGSLMCSGIVGVGWLIPYRLRTLMYYVELVWIRRSSQQPSCYNLTGFTTLTVRRLAIENQNWIAVKLSKKWFSSRITWSSCPPKGRHTNTQNSHNELTLAKIIAVFH